MITFVVAMDQNRGIGYRGKLPWHLPADLKFFRETTTGHTILMGRKTYESIGTPLPNRTNVVLTRNTGFHADGVAVVHSMEDALRQYAEEELFVIGGAEIFRELLPVAGRMLITQIGHRFPADVWFPEWDESEWQVAGVTPGVTDARNPYPFEFMEWKKKHL